MMARHDREFKARPDIAQDRFMLRFSASWDSKCRESSRWTPAFCGNDDEVQDAHYPQETTFRHSLDARESISAISFALEAEIRTT